MARALLHTFTKEKSLDSSVGRGEGTQSLMDMDYVGTMYHLSVQACQPFEKAIFNAEG